MRHFGEIPRALGFKRKPVADLRVLLDVLNEDEPHVYTLDGDVWDRIVADLKSDLASIQAMQHEAREPFDELTAGAIELPFATDLPRRLRWEPPFDPPSSLAGSFAPQQSYYRARRGLWLLAQSDAARLVHPCFGRDCAEKPYVFARETCTSKACIVGALRHARRFEPDAREMLRLWDEIRRTPDVSEDDLIELERDFPSFALRKRV